MFEKNAHFNPAKNNVTVARLL